MQTEYLFGRFRLIPTSRLLLENERVVELGGRTFDLLLCLVRRSGEVVTTSELMSLVWPWTVVEAGNVRVQISALRKALGDDGGAQRFIVTVPYTGYGFVAEVSRTDRPSLSQSGAQARSPFGTVSGIPPLPKSIVGRENSVDDLAAALLEHRCVAVVGPGGIGKTVVATLLARRFSALEGLPVTFVSLTSAVGAVDALSVVASALGSPENARQTIKDIRNLTRNRRMLLVLDNCEHMVEFVAQLAEQILRAACEVRILATSREPLGVRGERVIRLDAMETPVAYQSMTLDEAKSHSAINLFVQRAAACRGSLPLCDDDVPAISEICRRLDGNPLAIELAAANLDAMDVQQVLSDLYQPFSMLRPGDQLAESRHQTFEDNLDWSFELLSTHERNVLLDISVFSGAFSAEAAFAVTRERTTSDEFIHLAEALSSLESKSLLVAELTHHPVRYRLGMTTRAYAARRLARLPERATELARRHVLYFDQLLARHPPHSELAARPLWANDSAGSIDDIRSSIERTLETSELHFATRMILKSAPLWLYLDRAEELRTLATNALFEIRPEATIEEHSAALLLQQTVANSHWHSHGNAADKELAFNRSLELASGLGFKCIQTPALGVFSRERVQLGSERD